MNVNEVEKLIEHTFHDISRNGFSVWQCAFFGDRKITVIQDKDRDLFNRQLSFTDPLRIAAQYPVFTIDELNYLYGQDDQTQRMVFEAKSLSPCWIRLQYEEA